MMLFTHAHVFENLYHWKDKIQIACAMKVNGKIFMNNDLK